MVGACMEILGSKSGEAEMDHQLGRQEDEEDEEEPQVVAGEEVAAATPTEEDEAQTQEAASPPRWAVRDAALRLAVRRRCQEEDKQQQQQQQQEAEEQGSGDEPPRRTFLSLEEAGLVEMSGLSTHERFLCRLTISSLNLLRVISEQEGVPIEELNAGRVCDWFVKDKLKREQNVGSPVLQWDDPGF